jgi:predicted MFS family arabinose efflux permease
VQSASALANPQFRLLFIGNIVTMLGFGMMQVVQGVLAFDLTGHNRSVGFVAMGMGIPMLLLGPIGGALSDRMSKRMLLMMGQSAVGVVFFLIGLLTVLDIITIWMLAGMTLVMGCMFAALMPARQAWVGDLLQGPALANGVALQQLTMNATRIVGPLAAGGMIALSAIGIGGTYMAMGGLFVLAMGLLFLMQPTRARHDRGNSSVFSDLRVGLSYTWNAPDVRLLMLTFAGVVLTAFSYQQLMPGFLENELGQPANRIGIMFGATAVGGIILTLTLTRWGMGVNPAALMFTCGAALAGAVALLALSPTFMTALGAAAIVGAASSGFQMCNQVNLMQRTDPAYFGRVMSLTMTAFGLQMIMGFPAGALADAVGERGTLLLLAGCSLAVVAIGYLSAHSVGVGPRRRSYAPRV